MGCSRGGRGSTCIRILPDASLPLKTCHGMVDQIFRRVGEQDRHSLVCISSTGKMQVAIQNQQHREIAAESNLLPVCWVDTFPDTLMAPIMQPSTPQLPDLYRLGPEFVDIFCPARLFSDSSSSSTLSTSRQWSLHIECRQPAVLSSLLPLPR
jgi:hypothetical protein